jgi:protein-S-isoprenylcysteine O-methyltransferase Ste14
MATYMDYGILTGYWVLFCVIHHVFAMDKCKSIFRSKMGKVFRYYRLIYSFLALVTFILVLFHQYSVKSLTLDIVSQIRYFVGLPFGLAGIWLMGISIRKYFFKLSGIGVFYHDQSEVSLELCGIHKYIRHPLYLGTLLFAWSLLLFFPLLSNLLACAVLTSYVLFGIQSEEKKLVIIFGEDYKSYSSKTPALIPRIRLNELLNINESTKMNKRL